MQQEATPTADSGAAIAQKYGVQRSPHWDGVRKAHLNLPGQNVCAVCATSDDPQVHHIVPFHFCHLVYRGDLELDERNLMTLCEFAANNHHNLIGHLQNWEIYNPVGRDVMVTTFKGLMADELTKEKIIVNATWTQWFHASDKPVAWGQMSDKAKLTLRQFLDSTLPFIPTKYFSQPFAFMQGGDDGKNPARINTTYHDPMPGNGAN